MKTALAIPPLLALFALAACWSDGAFAWSDLRGDTLVVLSQEVDAAGTRSHWIMRRFLVETRRCERR